MLGDQKSLFGVGFLLGMLLAVVFHNYRQDLLSLDVQDLVEFSYDFAYEKWLFSIGLCSILLSPDENRYRQEYTDNNETDVELAVRPNTEAFFLHHHIPVVCIVFPTTVEGAVAVNNTWGQHCNQIKFYHHKLKNSTLPIKTISASSSFGLLCSVLLDLRREKIPFQWLLFATDNTYVIPENFRYFVASFNSSEPHYLGHTMTYWNVLYNWKEAGYAISKGTVDILLNKFNDQEACAASGKYWKNEDWYLGKHLHSLGIDPVDTRDEYGKGRFNGYSFNRLLFPGSVSIFEKYWKDSLYLSPDGPQCCSNHAISFNGILSNSKMYQLEYIFYHLRPFYSGGQLGNAPAPPPSHTPFLSWEEQRKEDELQRLLGLVLTTPAGPWTG